MAVTADLLNSTLADLRGPIEHTLEQKVPGADLLMKRGKISTEKGILIERTIMGGSPAQGVGISPGGGTTIPIGRTEQTKKIQVQPHRLVVAISIPKGEMITNDGKLGAIKLVKTYVDAVQKLYPVDLDRYWFSGTSPGHVFATSQLAGFNTLNGQVTNAFGLIGVTQGLIEFAATTSQNDTTQNLAKSSTYGYVNQYRNITSYASDGWKTYRAAYRDVAQFNPRGNEGPDFVYMDFDSYAQYEEDKATRIRSVTVQDKTDKTNDLMELEMGSARVIAAKNIVLTDFTGDAASGLAYYLTSEGVEFVWYQKPELSDFDDKVATSDSVIAKLEMMGCPLITGMRLQGAVTGGARL